MLPPQVLLNRPIDQDRRTGARDSGLLLRECLDVVQSPQEQQVRELLNRVADATRPEGITDSMDLLFNAPVIAWRP